MFYDGGETEFLSKMTMSTKPTNLECYISFKEML